jgi:hypothetical protein
VFALQALCIKAEKKRLFVMAVFGYKASCVEKWRIYVILCVRADNVIVVLQGVKHGCETVFSVIVQRE